MLLEQTTLGEFLTAVENVRKKSEMELTEIGLEDVESGTRTRRLSRRPSFLDRFVSVSRKNSTNVGNVEVTNRGDGNSDTNDANIKAQCETYVNENALYN